VNTRLGALRRFSGSAGPLGLFVAIAALTIAAAYAQPWAGKAPGATGLHRSGQYPLAPSEGPSTNTDSLAEAIAEHDAAIDAWLSASEEPGSRRAPGAANMRRREANGRTDPLAVQVELATLEVLGDLLATEQRRVQSP
jgi:hypothetical protein